MLLALPPEGAVEELGVVLLSGEVDGRRELDTEVDECWGPVVKVAVEGSSVLGASGLAVMVEAVVDVLVAVVVGGVVVINDVSLVVIVFPSPTVKFRQKCSAGYLPSLSLVRL